MGHIDASKNGQKLDCSPQCEPIYARRLNQVAYAPDATHLGIPENLASEKRSRGTPRHEPIFGSHQTV